MPLDEIRSTPFLLSQGNLIKAKVLAINSIGSSTISNANQVGGLVEKVPIKPPVAPLRNSATLKTSLVVDLTALIGSATGGSPILSYDLQWDNGNNVWTSVSGYTVYSTST